MSNNSGLLVKSISNNLGIGKLIDASDSSATVEYFCSMAQRFTETIPLNSLRRVRLSSQTKCYIQTETNQTWKIGRIYTWDEENKQYQIDLPDSKTQLATEAEIYVRCNLPITDPIDILAMKGQETPYFYKLRSQFSKCLIEQRKVSQGMTGLISANIELYPHQVEITRRILEDSWQRYILADEVGLGKTIEAGIILRQFLLDEPEKKALILVTSSLVEQWREELEHKFYLNQFIERVQILAIEDWKQLKINQKVDLLIIDQADQLAELRKTQIQCFEICKQLAHKSDRLLLLSHLPICNHEAEYLVMLHFLDPNIYQLNDLPGLIKKIQQQQQIGELIFALPANPQDILPQIRAIFAEDNYLINLINELEIRSKNSEEYQKILSQINTHINATYCLEKRILKTNRKAAQELILDRNLLPRTEYDLDERSYELHELLESWRTHAPNEKYQRIFLLLFRASSTWWGILEQIITGRLKGIASPEIIREFGNEDAKILVQTPNFPEEEETLKAILQLINTPSEDGDRLELLKIVLLYELSEILELQSFRNNIPKLLEMVKVRIDRPFSNDRFPKLVIFTSFTQTCQTLVKFLSNNFDEQAIASYQQGQTPEQREKNFSQFKSNSRCFLLVCDSSGETGKNLQFIDGLIHFDLPWLANNLEKRLGRIDRIGCTMNLKSWLLAGVDLEDSLQDAWYQLQKDGFEIFNESVANLQFYLDSSAAKLETKLFQDGAKGLVESIAEIRTEIEQEKQKISAANILQEIDINNEIVAQYFQTLKDYDADDENIKKATEGWLCNALHFQKKKDINIEGVRGYNRSSSDRKRTLVSPGDLKTYFANFLNKPGTYQRITANQNPGVNLYRIGEGLINSLTSYLDWDDRGQAFAIWRYEKNWDADNWVGFRFNYLVEMDWLIIAKTIKELGNKNIIEQALKRRVEALFPAQINTIFINTKMELVEDEKLLKILHRSYNNSNDTNLAKNRLSLLDNFIPSTEWTNLCYQGRKNSEQLLRNLPSFQELTQKYAQQANHQIENRINQLRLHSEKISKSNQQIQQEIELETTLKQILIQAITQPTIKTDSIGFIIVTNQKPPYE